MSTAFERLSNYDREMQRQRSLANVLSRTNRILTSDPEIVVRLNEKAFLTANVGNAPGFSSYPEIFIRPSKFGDIRQPSTVVELLGLNYHELAHLMFTPRSRVLRPVVEQLTSQERQAWNILEDQRIESLFTAMYQPAGKYFTAMVVKTFINESQSWEDNFLFTYGRSYLPLEIRQEFEARFWGTPSLAKKVKRIIDKFVRLNNQTYLYQPQQVIDLVKEFAKCMRGSTPNNSCEAKESSSGYVNTEQEKVAQEEDQRRRRKEKRTGEDQSGFWDEDDEDDESEGMNSEDQEQDGASDSSGGDDDEDVDDDEEGRESNSGDGSSEDESSTDGDFEQGSEQGSDGDSDFDSDSPGDGVGGTGEFFDDSELEDYLEEVLSAVEEDEGVNQEVDRIADATNDPNRIDFLDFGHAPFDKRQVDGAMQSAFRKISREFRKIYTDVEPGWKYGSDSGKLNVTRAMVDPSNFEEMFDEWEEGREQESGIECVINLDTSVSMSGVEIETSCRALWIIKRALDDVGAKTTVIGFDAVTDGLIGRDDKEALGSYRRYTSLGGNTVPAPAMEYSRQILSASPMPNKLYVILTDGNWQVSSYHLLLPAIPGTRMYVGINSGVKSNQSSRKYFHSSVDMTDENSLVSAVQDAVQHMLDSVRREAAGQWL